LPTAYELHRKILKDKLQPIAKNILGEEQCGYHKDRSTVDAIFTIKQIIEKCREFNRSLYTLFLDYEKANDKVDRDKLWGTLYSYDIPKNLVNAIKSLYNNTKIIVLTDVNKTYSNSLPVNTGLHQGSGLSPILFDIYMNKILEAWQKGEPKGIKLNNRCTIATDLFADDQILLAETDNDLQWSLYHLKEILKEYNMKISTEKTKVMATLGRDIIRTKVIIDDEKIE
jgi:hypothetical protein